MKNQTNLKTYCLCHKSYKSIVKTNFWINKLNQKKMRLCCLQEQIQPKRGNALGFKYLLMFSLDEKKYCVGPRVLYGPKVAFN